MSFSLILILVICYDLFLLLTTKVDKRKRNETRFDTITVSLKAIWLVLGSWFFVFYLTYAAHLCRTRVFVFFSLRAKNTCFFTITSKFHSFLQLMFALMLAVVRQLFGRRRRPASCSFCKFSSLRFSACWCYFCDTRARKKKRNHILRATRKSRCEHQIWLVFCCFSLFVCFF